MPPVVTSAQGAPGRVVYKTGICTSEELRNRRSIFGRVRPLSCLLLRDGGPNFEAVLADLTLDRNVTRLTYRGRFTDVNATVDALLQERYGPSEEVEIHDWAASDCLSSAEWAADLLPRLSHAKVVASDIVLYFVLLQRSGAEHYVLLPDGRPFQFIRPPFVIPLDRYDTVFYPVNRVLGWRARRQLPAVQQAAQMAEWSGVLDDRTVVSSPWEISKILLVHPEARLLANRESRFLIRQHSVFLPLAKPVQAIRTMNVLNLSYFQKQDMIAGAAAVHSSLTDRGVWILGRTRKEDQTDRNCVTLFEKRCDRFVVLRRINGGSEVESIVADFRS